MKKFLITVAASVLIFGGQAGAEASTNVENLDAQVAKTQDMGKWTHFRDKYILERDTDAERRRRKDWERRQRHYPPPPPPPKGRHRYPPPPPPPPPPIFGAPSPGSGAPPPPPRHR